jgi:hypothetical protein
MPRGSTGKCSGSRLAGRYDQHDAVGPVPAAQHREDADRGSDRDGLAGGRLAPVGGEPACRARRSGRRPLTSAAASGSAIRTGTAADSPAPSPAVSPGPTTRASVSGSPRRIAPAAVRPIRTAARDDDPAGTIPTGIDTIRRSAAASSVPAARSRAATTTGAVAPAAAAGGGATSGRSANTAAATSKIPMTTRRGQPASRAPIRASRTRLRPHRRANSAGSARR